MPSDDGHQTGGDSPTLKQRIRSALRVRRTVGFAFGSVAIVSFAIAVAAMLREERNDAPYVTIEHALTSLDAGDWDEAFIGIDLSIDM